MPMYEFVNRQTGERVTRYYHHESKPDTIKVRGQRFHWMPSLPQVSVKRHGAGSGVDYKDGSLPASRSLPKNQTPVVGAEKFGDTTLYRHANGLCSDAKGRRICRDATETKRQAADCGMVPAKD